MIMNTRFTEEVRGEIIGPYSLGGALYYAGKKQGPTLYGADDADLFDQAKRHRDRIRAECGSVFRDIYPLDAWELRIFCDD